MMSYPLEKDKGKAFGVFWAIFQFGSLIGSIIALAINIRSGKLSSVSTATYLVRFLFELFARSRVPHSTALGIHSHHVCGYGIDNAYPTSGRDYTRRRYPREGPGILDRARGAQ
jgi:hypothetical protein